MSIVTLSDATSILISNEICLRSKQSAAIFKVHSVHINSYNI